MISNTIKTLCYLCLIFSYTGVQALPVINDEGPWSVTWENDLMSLRNTDRHYTNGLQVTKTSEVYQQFNQHNTFTWLANHIDWLPIGFDTWLQHRTTLSLGQIMQTPRRSEP